MTASFGTSLDEHLEDIITGSNVMALVAMQRKLLTSLNTSHQTAKK